MDLGASGGKPARAADAANSCSFGRSAVKCAGSTSSGFAGWTSSRT
jgi:hypothetical protein